MTKKSPRETSDRVSSAAARLMQLVKAGYRFWSSDGIKPYTDVTLLVKAVVGSALVQDTTPGKRPAKRRGRK